MESSRKRAERALARAQALGLTDRNGKPLVIDQMLELVAAEEGFRNWHAFAAHQRKRASGPKTPDIRPDFPQEIQWVVYAASERDPTMQNEAETGFWNNKEGWGTRQSATTFTPSEKKVFHLPLSAGGDAQWLAFDAPAPDAIASDQAEESECVRCGLPTSVDDDGYCNQCHVEWEREHAREMADDAYAAYDFGPGVVVEADSGWLSDGRQFSRPVFVRFPYDGPDQPTTAVDFRVIVEDGAVQSVRALVRDTGERIGGRYWKPNPQMD